MTQKPFAINIQDQCDIHCAVVSEHSMHLHPRKTGGGETANFDIVFSGGLSFEGCNHTFTASGRICGC